VTKIDQPADYMGAVFGDRARRAFRQVEGALAGEDYLGAARELWKRGPLQSAFMAEVAATEARAGGYLDDTPTLIKTVREGIIGTAGLLRAGRELQELQAGREPVHGDVAQKPVRDRR
jgi:hypothetical protein